MSDALPPRNPRRRALTVVGVGAGLFAFFAAPLIVTYDSVHYAGFLPILRGQQGFSHWDVGRGPGFPLWLWAIEAWVGIGVGPALAVSAACLGVSAWALRFALRSALGARASAAFTAVALTFAFDPTSFGYFHTLLTEYLAATLFALGAALAAWRLRLWSTGGHGSLVVELGAGVLAAFAYHVKQPYVAGLVAPLVFASLWALRHTRAWRQVAASLGVTLGVVALSLVGWKSVLPASGKAAEESRTTQALLANNVSSTCLRASEALFVKSDSNVQVCPSESWKTLSTANDYGLPSACSDGRLSTSEALRICAVSLWKSPLALTLEFSAGLARLFSFSGESENAVIAHKVFRVRPEEPAVFWLPPELEPGAEPYRQSQARSGLYLRAWGKLGGASRVLHGVLGVASLLLAAASWFLALRSRARGDVGLGLLFVTANSAAAYSLALAVLGTTLDRYQYPAFPLALLALAVAASSWRVRRGGVGHAP